MTLVPFAYVLTPGLFPFPEERRARQEEATNSVVVRGLKAAGLATAAVGVVHAAAQSFVPAYQKVNFRIKVFCGVAFVAACFSNAGERQNLENLARSREIEAARVEAHDEARLMRAAK